MRELKSKQRLFRFEDGTILDLSKIDYIDVHAEENQDLEYIIQISGKRLTFTISNNSDNEIERLIETWDMYIRNEEQNAELNYLHEKEISTIISFLNRKLDIVLAVYTKVHKDEVPEYPLDHPLWDVKDDWSPNFKRG